MQDTGSRISYVEKKLPTEQVNQEQMYKDAQIRKLLVPHASTYYKRTHGHKSMHKTITRPPPASV